ncbi:MAG: polymer-forming cytoskeletal protein [Eubacteriales bacterium]
MFGKKDTIDIKMATKSTSSNITFIAEDCNITGNINSKGSARIDGQVEGTVMIAEDLIIGQTASLKASIEAKTVTIAGEVNGNIVAKEMLELSSTARLYGDISTKQLRIDSGARFVGSSSLLEEEKSYSYSSKDSETDTSSED